MFIDLGEHYNEEYISLVDISKRKDVSKKFLEQIVPLFKNTNLLLGNRGNQGGYRLAKSPKQITLKDIIHVTENIFVKQVTGNAPIDTTLKEIDDLFDHYLESVTLEKLIEKQVDSYSNNYFI